MYNAHLNGGPKDDEYWVVEGEAMRVPILARINNMVISMDDYVTSIKQGEYRMRIDGNGDPVPHSLDGTIEFDWIM